jgi:hypothetical protein
MQLLNKSEGKASETVQPGINSIVMKLPSSALTTLLSPDTGNGDHMLSKGFRGFFHVLFKVTSYSDYRSFCLPSVMRTRVVPPRGDGSISFGIVRWHWRIYSSVRSSISDDHMSNFPPRVTVLRNAYYCIFCACLGLLSASSKWHPKCRRLERQRYTVLRCHVFS